MKSKIIFASFAIVVFGVVVFLSLRLKASNKLKSSPSEEITTKVLGINQRPYWTITSSKNPNNSQFDGKFFIMSLENVPVDSTVDYELTYDTSTNPQGIGGPAQLTSGKYEKEAFFGTKSTRDYHFDTGVEFGKTTLMIKSKTNEYEISADFRLQKIGPQKTVLSDQSNTFEMQIPQGAISKTTSIITQKTIGLPNAYSANFLLDQPVSFLTQASSILTKPADLKIKVDKNSAGKVVIVGWDHANKTWKEFETTFDPQTSTATAKVDLLSTYIVVEKVG